MLRCIFRSKDISVPSQISRLTTTKKIAHIQNVAKITTNYNFKNIFAILHFSLLFSNERVETIPSETE